MKKNFYLSLVLSLPTFFLQAQPFPGGISSNLTLWVKSDFGTSSTGGFVNSWGYVNNANNFTAAGGLRPALTVNALNFKPGITFSGAQAMDGPSGVNVPITPGNDAYTVFAVWRSNTVSAFQRLWSQGNFPDNTAEKFSLATWNDGRYGDELGWTPFDQAIQRTYTINTWNISQINLLNTAVSDFELTDDRNISTAPDIRNTDPTATDGAALRNIGSDYTRIGNSWAGSPFDTYFNGDISEIIVYNGHLTTAERDFIFSYLAVKYGITLKTNLISSFNTLVWDATTNAAYNNAVFGLALDISTGLLVTQSNSIETGTGDGTGQPGKANIVLSNPDNLTTDETYLIIGNDNGSLAETASLDLPVQGAGSLRLGREWKVQATNDAGNISLSVDLTGLSYTGTVPDNFRLMVDEDGDGDFTTGVTRFYTPGSVGSNIVSFGNVKLLDGEVFALITSTGPLLPVTWKSFTAGLVNGGISLNWAVENNVEGKTFEIEHSSDGKNFSKAGEVANKKEIQSYKFMYNTATAGIHYFRIRQVDLDGKAIYSKVVSVLVKGNSAYTIRLLNNPIRNNYAEFEIMATKPGKATIELWSSAGAKITSQQQAVGQGTSRVRIPMDRAAAGNYIVKLQIGDVVVSENVMKF